eukprot:3292608-Amphidinium_carterae.2
MLHSELPPSTSFIRTSISTGSPKTDSQVAYASGIMLVGISSTCTWLHQNYKARAARCDKLSHLKEWLRLHFAPHSMVSPAKTRGGHTKQNLSE